MIHCHSIAPCVLRGLCGVSTDTNSTDKIIDSTNTEGNENMNFLKIPKQMDLSTKFQAKSNP